MDKIFERVGKTYIENKSVSKTASKCLISRVKVRKILISLGLYQSELSSQIAKMLEKGLDKNSICKELKISRSCLNEHLPYKKGLYQGGERSKQALRSERFRIKENRNKNMINNLKMEKERP